MADSHRNAIVSMYGLDVSCTRLEWDGWSAHKKYSEKITISNLNTKTIHLQIKAIPNRHPNVFRIHNHSQHDIIKIRGGHCNKIAVTFCPLEIEKYSDELILSIAPSSSSSSSSFNSQTTPDKLIKIALNADIPKTSLEIPNEIDFGFIAVKQESVLSFEMVNHGDTAVDYKWCTTHSPLLLEPAHGVIEKFSKQSISIKYVPASAQCVEMKVGCVINSKGKKEEIIDTHIKAMCTYPFIKISSHSVNMAAISIGDCNRKLLKIENCSPVSTLINIKNDRVAVDYHHDIDIEHDEESVFTLNPAKQCRIDAHSSIDIEIKFKPRTVGVRYTQHYIIETLCGYKLKFKVYGQADSPQISCSAQMLNFHEVELGMHKTERFTLSNHSKIRSFFEFTGISDDVGSSFLISPKRGHIAPNQCVEIKVKFQPNNAMLFNKCIYCIIHHHIPLSIQLVACCIDDKTKFILQPQFEQLLKEIARENDDNERYDESNTNMSHPRFSALFDNDDYVKVSSTMVEFESCSLSQGIAPYHNVTVFNTDRSQQTAVSVNWDIPQPYESNVFSIFPPFMDVRSFSSADFSAAFQPSHDFMYFHREIDCYYHYKPSRNSESPLQLNCVSVHLFGDSFGDKASNRLDANIKLSTNRVEFTPCCLGSSIYATIKVDNLCEKNPVIWKINHLRKQNGNNKSRFNSPSKTVGRDRSIHDEDSKTQESDQMYKADDGDVGNMFDFIPNQGYIPPNSFQLIIARFEPWSRGKTTFCTDIIFNKNAHSNNKQSLQLIGHAVEPKLHLANNEIFVIPTCIGMNSIECIELYNSSPIAIHYEWQIPAEYLQDKIICIEPMSGILDINEKKKSQITFSPNAISEKYTIECKCFYDSVSGKSDLEQPKYETLIINACCNESIVDFVPNESDFGAILIDVKTRKSVAIQNNADCKLNCDFYIEAESVKHSQQNREISLFVNNCDIPPKTRKELELNINAIHPGHHKYKLMANVKRIDGKGSITSFSNIQFNAIWPRLRIVDMQCDDMLLSKESLWSLFEINALNQTLQSDLTKYEREWNDVHLESNKEKLQDTFTNIQFDLGVKTLKYGATSKIYVNIQNTSSIASVVNIKYQSQLLCQPENWVQHGCEPEEDHSFLFEVEPKHFELAANAATVVSFTYHHKLCGEHDTKMLFSIQNGKQIHLHLHGETIASDFHPRLCLKQKECRLRCQRIGLLSQQIKSQFIPIYNESANDLVYTVDTSSIQRINEQNYQFQVFEVVNVCGIIKKHSWMYLEIKFHPIEAKEYAFNLRVNAEINDRDIQNPEATFLNVPIVANGVNGLVQASEEEECVGRSYSAEGMIKLPGCGVRLSSEILDFGVIPLRANARKLVMIYNEDNQYPVHFEWQKLIPYVTVKEMKGEIQANSSVTAEICIRCEQQAVEISDCICCLLWNEKYEWRLYCKVNCSVVTDVEMQELKQRNLVNTDHLIQTDKPLAIGVSLLSPRSQKRMNSMTVEAEEIGVDCCKSLLLMALNSNEVESALRDLPDDTMGMAVDDDAEDGSNTLGWKHLSRKLKSTQQGCTDTEFDEFMEYVLSETVFNITSEMLQNFDV